MAYISKRTGKEVDELLDRVERGGGGASITVDTELDAESNNAIANSVVSNAIFGLGESISELQAKATPSGDPMHYVYESIGARWNADTGYWEFYDMADITNEQMSKAFARGSWYMGTTAIGALTAFNEQSISAIRFNIARTGPWSATCDFDYFAQENKWIEFINLTFDNNMISKPFASANYLTSSFYGCSNLRRIYGEINVTDAKNAFTDTFKGCVKLEDVEIYGLTKDVSFADSPLSVESATYMIANANASSAFTITFRADRQAVFEANSDFIAAKSAKPNITILYQ